MIFVGNITKLYLINNMDGYSQLAWTAGRSNETKGNDGKKRKWYWEEAALAEQKATEWHMNLFTYIRFINFYVNVESIGVNAGSWRF